MPIKTNLFSLNISLLANVIIGLYAQLRDFPYHDDNAGLVSALYDHWGQDTTEPLRKYFSAGPSWPNTIKPGKNMSAMV